MKILEQVKVKDGRKWWYQWVVEGDGDEAKDDDDDHENFDDEEGDVDDD